MKEVIKDKGNDMSVLYEKIVDLNYEGYSVADMRYALDILEHDLKNNTRKVSMTKAELIKACPELQKDIEKLKDIDDSTKIELRISEEDLARLTNKNN